MIHDDNEFADELKRHKPPLRNVNTESRANDGR